MSLQTATERLCEMLDERGVEWSRGCFYHSTYFVIDKVHYSAYEQGGKLYLKTSVGPITPEQTIAASVGAGTCHITERHGDWYCDACGNEVGSFDPTSELFIDGNALELWEFCPRCGSKVVNE